MHPLQPGALRRSRPHPQLRPAGVRPLRSGALRSPTLPAHSLPGGHRPSFISAGLVPRARGRGAARKYGFSLESLEELFAGDSEAHSRLRATRRRSRTSGGSLPPDCSLDPLERWGAAEFGYVSGGLPHSRMSQWRSHNLPDCSTSIWTWVGVWVEDQRGSLLACLGCANNDSAQLASTSS